MTRTSRATTTRLRSRSGTAPRPVRQVVGREPSPSMMTRRRARRRPHFTANDAPSAPRADPQARHPAGKSSAGADARSPRRTRTATATRMARMPRRLLTMSRRTTTRRGFAQMATRPLTTSLASSFRRDTSCGAHLTGAWSCASTCRRCARWRRARVSGACRRTSARPSTSPCASRLHASLARARSCPSGMDLARAAEAAATGAGAPTVTSRHP